jgi:hypothetical protein
MSEDTVISEQSAIFPQIVAGRLWSGDATWISLMVSLGKTWTITGSKDNNRKNVYLSMKEYWKGTYEQ